MDQLADQMGVSRSEVVRQLIDRGLSGGSPADSTASAIIESFGALRDIEPVERGETERERYLAEAWRS